MPPVNFAKMEEEIADFWEKNKIFQKSVESRPLTKPYVFYDGPPFATGLPHYGHIVASLMKDAVPRYWTMRGFRVERKWGWDCHGLPIENIVEEKLKLKSRKDIEDFGAENFNEECRRAVLTYAKEWKKTIRRMGRFVDMENAYHTMDLNYMESVWWVFSQLWKKGLIYKGRKPMHICPRCVTPLSNFEVTQNYKDIEDLSVIVKFKIKNAKEKLGLDGDVYILAWTTTPWTLPGNALLAVNKGIEYLILSIKDRGGWYIVAKDRAKEICGDKVEIMKKVKGSDLIGLEYEPLFPYFQDTPNAFRVVAADFVSTEEGAGIVHIAPAFGEDDYNVGNCENIPLIQHVTMDGRFKPEVKDFAGLEVKPRANQRETDEKIVGWLKQKGLLFAKEKITHSYPHCWRCDTPLLNYATASWFVKVAQMIKELLKNNGKIRWVPEHIKEGRFGEWLKGARDWAVSRNRFWGTPLPIWENEDGEVICVGNVAELEKLTGEKIKDLHKHKIDKLEIRKDGKVYRRIPEVLDCWFESGSMPYAQFHYPFENKEKFEAGFPAEFIAEGQDQTRGWFYTLHVLAAAIFDRPAFKNVIVNGIVLAEDGKKMAKRLKNYPEPEAIMEKYGADALRYYFLASPVMEAENLNFSENGVREAYNKVINTLWNVLEFYRMYSSVVTPGETNGLLGNKKDSSACGLRMTNHVLDKWILAKLNILIKEVAKGMEEYKLIVAVRPIGDFINELSTWWLRRSRGRFKSGSAEEKLMALNTLYLILNTLSKVIAPFTPFVAEKIYQELTKNKESVHLEEWPAANEKLIDKKILDDMKTLREVVSLCLERRAKAGIPVRQTLGKIIINDGRLNKKEYLELLKEELNVEEVIFDEKQTEPVILDTVITPELKEKGLARELSRQINQLRKEKGLTVKDKVVLIYETEEEIMRTVFEKYGSQISCQVLAKEIKSGRVGEGEELKVGEYKIKISLNK